MEVTGIICEYNPFHTGHKKQIDTVRRQIGSDSGIVCLMSGSFVQRGAPAIVDKSLRAEAAVRCGADLVLELPVSVSLSSAEGFAAGGVKILAPFCDHLCFGAETPDSPMLMRTAQYLLSEDFRTALHYHLDEGLSFPAARQASLEELGLDAAFLMQPNNILAVEYCKAILQQKASITPMPIQREGGYHDVTPDAQNPSATFLRAQMLSGETWKTYTPTDAACCFQNAVLHTTAAGERAILGKLRTMTDEEFEQLPYGSEGLWRKFMHAARSCTTLEELLTQVKSKRYTRTRLDRMTMCAFLGLNETDIAKDAPYIRVLAFNDKGREILKSARKTGTFLNAGEQTDSAYQAFENRCGSLYGLFATSIPDAPHAEKKRRIYYQP